MPSVMCPKCSAKLNLSKIVEGARITCPSCGHKFQLTANGAKQRGRAGAVADPDMEDELQEDRNFFGDDPVVWMKIGGFCLLLLLPMIIVLIWNLSRTPSYVQGSVVDMGQIQPVDHDKGRDGPVAFTGRDGKTIHVQMIAKNIGKWESADYSMLQQQPANQEDRDLGVWKIREDGKSIEEGWDIITIQEPLETDVPPLPFVDGFISAYKIGLAYVDATVELYATESRGKYTVRAVRRIEVPAVTLPLRRLAEGGWGEDKNRPNGVFRVSDYFPQPIVDKMPFETERFRDTYELVVRVRPGHKVSNAYALVSSDDSVITYSGTELKVTVEYTNVTDKTLRNPYMAVDIFDKDSYLIGTYYGDATPSGKSFAPGETINFTLKVPYPEGKKPESTDRDLGWSAVPRGFGVAN